MAVSPISIRTPKLRAHRDLGDEISVPNGWWLCLAGLMVAIFPFRHLFSGFLFPHSLLPQGPCRNSDSFQPIDFLGDGRRE
jgi:hypothetical protein